MLVAAAPPPASAGQPSAPAYPEIYRSHRLPELPGATLVSIGRQAASLRDGVRIRLTSAKSVAEVRDFYRKALAAEGWQEQDSPAARAARTNPNIAVVTLTKDRLAYSVTIMAPPNATGTQVIINVVER